MINTFDNCSSANTDRMRIKMIQSPAVSMAIDVLIGTTKPNKESDHQ